MEPQCRLYRPLVQRFTLILYTCHGGFFTIPFTGSSVSGRSEKRVQLSTENNVKPLEGQTDRFDAGRGVDLERSVETARGVDTARSVPSPASSATAASKASDSFFDAEQTRHPANSTALSIKVCLDIGHHCVQCI